MSKTIQSDEVIIKQLQSRTPNDRNQALTYIYEVNFKMVAYFIKKNSGTEADAEDIFQDSLIAIYNKAVDGSLVLTSSLQTFVYSIARNLWLKKLRNTNRNIELKDTHENLPIEEHFYDSIIKNERNELVADLVEKMGGDCKKVLRFFYYDRMSMKEIMHAMGWQSEQVAKNKKSTCMKNLKALIVDNPAYQASLK